MMNLFVKKFAIYPNLKWGNKDVGLWLNLIIPQKPVYARPQPQSNLTSNASASVYKKGTCYAFNENQCKWLNSCRYRHECSFCFGSHPVSRCFKRTSSNQVLRDHTKSLHACEANRNASMVNVVPRQGESTITN